MPTPAVIFDMDGVLVDSYHAHFESWRRLAGECDVEFTEDIFAATFGRTSRDIIGEVWPAPAPGPGPGPGLSEKEIVALDDRKESLYREIIAANFPAMDGAVELIDALEAAGFKLAVGSSGPPANISMALNLLDRRESFAATIDGTRVSRGKPDPQVFLLAAEAMGADPVDCVVIEDAPAGIEAARRAEMTPIGLASTGRTVADLADAGLVITSLRDLSPQLIHTLLRDKETA